MGYNTTITICNDGAENIERFPEEFAKIVLDACSGVYERPGATINRTVPLGNHCNMITVHKPRHMADWAMYVQAGGCVVDVSTIKEKDDPFITSAIHQMEYELKRLKKLEAQQKTEDCPEAQELMRRLEHGPILRKLMSREEIKVANKLAKEGKICKGTSDDKQKTVQFSKW